MSNQLDRWPETRNHEESHELIPTRRLPPYEQSETIKELNEPESALEM